MQSPNNRLDQDHYKVLGVDYDATEDSIRTSYLRLALKWHPDKHNGASAATLKFQEISEAYRVLSDPLMRHEYDIQGNYGLQDYNYTSCGLVITIEGSVPGRKLKSEASLPHLMKVMEQREGSLKSMSFLESTKGLKVVRGGITTFGFRLSQQTSRVRATRVFVYTILELFSCCYSFILKP